MSNILLSICIPTFQRASYLDLCLNQIARQIDGAEGKVEIVVSDNASTDNTGEVVRKHIAQGLRVRFLQSETNLGSDRNFFKCFDAAEGKYVLLFGDDDILTDGALLKLVQLLERGDYGVVFMKAYGYDVDFRAEKPHNFHSSIRFYRDHEKFLKKIYIFSTFISSNVVNKSLIADFDVEPYVGSNLLQTYWVLAAAIRAQENAYISDYMISCKRNNSGGYSPFRVFSKNLNTAFEAFLEKGLTQSTIRSVNRRVLLHYFPYYILEARSHAKQGEKLRDVYADLRAVYKDYFSFWLLTVPLMKWPYLFALPFGLCIIAASRISRGEFLRLLRDGKRPFKQLLGT